MINRPLTHIVKNQLIMDNSTSLIGTLIGRCIQPAQSKPAIPHKTIEQLKIDALAAHQKYKEKLDSKNANLIGNKNHIKKKYFKKCVDALSRTSQQYLSIQTKEGRILDSILISPKDHHSLSFKDQYFNIHILGANQRMGKQLINLHQLADCQNRNILTFDYSNVGYSLGSAIPNTNRMVADASATLSFLLEQGVPPQNITLHGYSLGGYIATLLAAHCHKNNIHINIFACCAPMELTGPVAHFLNISQPYVRSFIGYLLTYYEYEKDAIQLWDAIPAEYKEHFYLDINDAQEQVADNWIPVTSTIAGKHNTTPYDDTASINQKLKLLESALTTCTDKNTITKLKNYKDLIKNEPLGSSYHQFAIFNAYKKKSNPHATKPYLLFNPSKKHTLAQSYDYFAKLTEHNIPTHS